MTEHVRSPNPCQTERRIDNEVSQRLETKIKAATFSLIEVIGSRVVKSGDEVVRREASDSHRRPPEPAEITGITPSRSHMILNRIKHHHSCTLSSRITFEAQEDHRSSPNLRVEEQVHIDTDMN